MSRHTLDSNTALPLHVLTQQIADVVNMAFASPVWIIAEVTDLRVAQNGHCYLQLIEKDPRTGQTLASVRAMVWANRWWLLRDSFLQQTGQTLQNGLRVMLQVQVSMHGQYGLSLQILDFDPSYTLGEMARRRIEIIRQLQADGIIDMNRELPFPTLPQRIAVISASEAAGFGDFCRQLHDNIYGLQFYTCLFPAIMQGQQTADSVISALERIYDYQHYFDLVVIIRGGGATVDLASFDSYDLASTVANFPIPVITGIGHDRDQNVLDRVAHTSVKTPTAAAALLIDAMSEQLRLIEGYYDTIIDSTKGRIEHERQRLTRCTDAIRGTRITLSQWLSRLVIISQRIQMQTHQRIEREQDKLEHYEQAVQRHSRQRIEREQDKLEHFGQTIHMAQPDVILRRGFSITRLDGHAVKAASQVPPGAHLQIQTADGTLEVCHTLQGCQR